MSSKLIMFVFFVFLTGNIVCMIAAGEYFDAGDMNLMQSLTGYSNLQLSGAGILTIPKLGVGFFMHGLPMMLFWNYPFLDGGWELFKYFVLFPFTIGVIAVMGMLVFNVAQGIFGRIR
jgi:hypothetical protein